MSEEKARQPISYEAFMCATDFECECGRPMSGNRFFAEIEDLKREMKCTDFCGVVKVRMTGVEVIEQNRFNDVQVDGEVREDQ